MLVVVVVMRKDDHTAQNRHGIFRSLKKWFFFALQRRHTVTRGKRTNSTRIYIIGLNHRVFGFFLSLQITESTEREELVSLLVIVPEIIKSLFDFRLNWFFFAARFDWPEMMMSGCGWLVVWHRKKYITMLLWCYWSLCSTMNAPPSIDQSRWMAINQSIDWQK